MSKDSSQAQNDRKDIICNILLLFIINSSSVTRAELGAGAARTTKNLFKMEKQILRALLRVSQI
jgi:hypothetical protein